MVTSAGCGTIFSSGAVKESVVVRTFYSNNHHAWPVGVRKKDAMTQRKIQSKLYIQLALDQRLGP